MKINIELDLTPDELKQLWTPGKEQINSIGQLQAAFFEQLYNNKAYKELLNPFGERNES